MSEKVWRLCMRTQRQKDAAEYRFFVVFLYADGRGLDGGYGIVGGDAGGGGSG